MHEGHHIKRGDIYQLDANGSDVLQFISQRFVISFSLLTGRKAHLKKQPLMPDQ
jgi:hypothetical protein